MVLISVSISVNSNCDVDDMLSSTSWSLYERTLLSRSPLLSDRREFDSDFFPFLLSFCASFSRSLMVVLCSFRDRPWSLT